MQQTRCKTLLHCLLRRIWAPKTQAMPTCSSSSLQKSLFFFYPIAVTMLDGCGCPKEGWIGVGVCKMWPEWLKGGKWPMGPMWLARLKGEDFSCMHLESSSKHSDPFLFFLDLLDIFRFLVWIPSFFMVRGLFTCNKIQEHHELANLNHVRSMWIPPQNWCQNCSLKEQYIEKTIRGQRSMQLHSLLKQRKDIMST